MGTTVKPVLSDHSKIDKTNILMTNGSLMKVESMAECCDLRDNRLKKQFLVFLSGCLRQVLLYIQYGLCSSLIKYHIRTTLLDSKSPKHMFVKWGSWRIESVTENHL